MLGLTLREEFRGKRLRGTQIELSGATQLSADSFLQITYPSGDVLKAIEGVGPGKRRPLVLMGDRGQGKSHLMAVLHHSLTDPRSTDKWLKSWSATLKEKTIGDIALREEMHVISESLHRQQYKFLWDILFDRHPSGTLFRGRWEGRGDKKTDIPDYELILELLKTKPTALILDEFQTWYDGLTNTKQYPWKTWAFNFVQILSEIADQHPDLLVLVVSVRNGNSDAYLQIHRVSPTVVDFKGPNARRDRLRLLLHRLFENRPQVSEDAITRLITAHLKEYLRLSQIPPSEHERSTQEFVEAWPFAPHVMRLLEDQVLIATEAQETRDLIRILVDLYKTRGESSPVITAADFCIEEEQSGIAALLESVANRHHAALREKALRNLEAVRDAVDDPSRDVPNLSEIVSALWLRSLALDNLAGADPDTLQIDVTRSRPIDTNTFQVQLSHILDNSFNIHRIGNRLVFREDENAEAKLRSAAKNDKLFSDGSDCAYLAKEIRYVLSGGDDVARNFRVIALGKHWRTAPFADVEDVEQPDQWDERVPILVLPECPDNPNATLAKWLKDHLLQYRNTVRFLMPRATTNNIYSDQDLILLSRAIIKAQEWRPQDAEYGRLQTKFQTELRNLLKERFDRFAILKEWNYSDIAKSTFYLEAHGEKGSKIPSAIHDRIASNLFVPEEFEELILDAASNNSSVGKVIRELKEPRPSGQACIPWLGDAEVKDRITRVCAAGFIAINLRNNEILQRNIGEDEQTAWARMKGKLGTATGRHLDESYILLPQAVPATAGGNSPPTRQPAGTSSTPTPAPTPDPSTNEEQQEPSLFGSTTTTATLVPLSAPATSPLNLLGKVEAWGIGPGTSVKSLKLNVGQLTGAQVQKLLRSLPDGLTYELMLEKEEP